MGHGWKSGRERQVEKGEQELTPAGQGHSRTQWHKLVAEVPQGISSHLLTLKCMTMMLNITNSIFFFFFSDYCIKSQMKESFLRQQQHLSQKSLRISCRKLYLMLWLLMSDNGSTAGQESAHTGYGTEGLLPYASAACLVSRTANSSRLVSRHLEMWIYHSIH